jgi:hypothetical protein
MFHKLNTIFEKSNNLYIRFIISFLVVLTPFILFSIIIFIGIHNYLRAVVLVLFLIVSFFEKTRDNKFILGFIGLIPMGFYVFTSPVFISYMLGVQALNIGGILWDNKIMTIISGVSIYGIIKTVKGASSMYEWFMNTGLGGYFFPEYKNIKDQLNLKNQTITQLITENNSLVTSLKTVKDALKQLQLTAIGTFNSMEDKLYKQQEQILTNQPQNDIIIPVQDTVSVAQLHQQLGNAITKSDTVINHVEEVIIQNQQNTQQIITIQQSTEIVSVSDATITAIQKVLTGGGVLIGFEILSKLINTDSSYLLQGYALLKRTLGPYMMPAAAYVTGDVVVRTTNVIKKTSTIAVNVYRETQKIVLKGIMNIVENTTTIPNPNTTQIEFKDPKFIKNTTPPAGIQDMSLVRKPNYRDFVNPDDYKKTPPIIPIPQPLSTPTPTLDVRTSELKKSITERPYNWPT